MIGRLRGVVISKQPPYLLIDVQGVGYEVQAPMSTFYKLPALGQETILHTHLSINENLHQLFGFAELRERSLFRTLIKVNGVGPKLGIGILSGMEADDIARCVRDNNVKALIKVPGIGQKTAERLVIELRDRLKDWDVAPDDLLNLNERKIEQAENAAYAEAESALIALGYKPADAARMISAALKLNASATREELIRHALRSLSGN
jgi:Holliday junction DNA helicase RuvA